MKFKDAPEYSKLSCHLLKCLNEIGEKNNDIFDWSKKSENKKKNTIQISDEDSDSVTTNNLKKRIITRTKKSR